MSPDEAKPRWYEKRMNIETRMRLVTIWAHPDDGPHRDEAQQAIRAAVEEAHDEGRLIALTMDPGGAITWAPKVPAGEVLEVLDSAGGAFAYAYEKQIYRNGYGQDDPTPQVPVMAHLTVYL
jgi:hypothetical protein